jgi:bla regulator protein blaR1
MIPFLSNHVWQSTLCGGLVWALAFVLRKNRAGVRYWLWFAASVKFLLPFSVLLGLGSAIPWRSAPPAVQQAGLTLRFYAAPLPMEIAKRPASVPERANPIPSPMPQILFGIWLAGFAASSAFSFHCWRKMRAALRRATPLSFALPVPVMSTPARIEPGVFGILRPVLLLPQGLAGRLPAAQLEAIVEHELCHVRRRDNLTGAIHLVVETLFWFHPIVWWIRARLLEERERACDEFVLRRGNEPRVYAEGILNVCKSYLESPLMCVSGVSGSDLKRRIREILDNRAAVEMDWPRKALLATAAAAAILAPVGLGMMNAPSLRAQAQPAQQVAFEVASIKEHKTDDREFQIGFMPSGKIVFKGISLTWVITNAYDLPFQTMGLERLTGVPKWVSETRYDIEATPEPGAIPAGASPAVRRERMRMMLQALLAQRFQLAIRRETKELPVYAVVVGKGGPKLQKSDLTEKECDARTTTFNDPEACHDMFGGMGRGVHAKAASVADLAGWVANWSDRPVLDKSGIEGLYKFDTEGWQSMRQRLPPPPGQESNAEDVALADPTRATLFQIFDRLGLKLESQKAPVDMYVIESIQRPTEN